jgi:D-alanine-D-alanine ligase-like ATP-grasp enzyme
VKILLLEPAEPDPDSTDKTNKICILLKQLGYEVVEIPCNVALYENVIREKPEIVFNLASIYEWNKTNLIPAILEIAGVRYTGSGILALSLVRNFTKLFPLLSETGIRVAPYQILKAGSTILNTELRYPLNLYLDGTWRNLVLANEIELKSALQGLPPQTELVLQERRDGEVVSQYILDSTPFLSSLTEPYWTPALKIYQLMEARGLVRIDFIKSDEPLMTGIEVAPDPLDEKLLQRAAQAGWDAEKIIQTLVEHAGRDH